MTSTSPRNRLLLTAVILFFAQGCLLVIAHGGLNRASANLAPWSWPDVGDTTTLLLSAIGLFALVVGTMSTLGTMAIIVSLVSPQMRWTDSLQPFALPVVRRLTTTCAALSLTAAATVGGASPVGARTIDEPARTTSQGISDEPVVRTATLESAPSDAPHLPAIRADSQSSTERGMHPSGKTMIAQREATPEHIVVAGDNLWSIAKQHLAASGMSTLSSDTVASYWSDLIAANRDQLRSGNPNLIFPGERIVLPPPTF